MVVNPDEVILAIGRGGQNIRLASRLSGYEIDVYREIPENEEDLDIEEFDDELSKEIIDRLRGIGCDTAKAVLDLSVDELSRRAGFESDLSEHIIALMRGEFEEEEGEEEEA